MSAKLPRPQLPNMLHHTAPESPLGLALALCRPQSSPFTRPRIALELSSPPKYKSIFLSPGAWLWQWAGASGFCSRLLSPRRSPESHPDPSREPYLSDLTTPSSAFSPPGPALPSQLCWLTAPLGKNPGPPAHVHSVPHCPHPALWRMPELPLLPPMCLENLWFARDTQPGPLGEGS